MCQLQPWASGHSLPASALASRHLSARKRAGQGSTAGAPPALAWFSSKEEVQTCTQAAPVPNSLLSVACAHAHMHMHAHMHVQL